MNFNLKKILSICFLVNIISINAYAKVKIIISDLRGEPPTELILGMIVSGIIWLLVAIYEPESVILAILAWFSRCFFISVLFSVIFSLLLNGCSV